MSLSWYLILDEKNEFTEEETTDVGYWNLTYNLLDMLNVAFGLTDEPNGLSVPEQVVFKKEGSKYYFDQWKNKTAQECEQSVQDAIERMEADPEKYKQYNPPNGWGTYEGALTILRDFLKTCREYPHAKVRIYP
jgi:hypothetical protein